MLGSVGRKMVTARNLGRCGKGNAFSTSGVKRGGHDDHHDVGGIPGANLPFGINNRYKLAAYFAFWFGSGFATPFLLLRHQLLKKNQ